VNTYGYLLMGQGKVDSALVIFRKNIKDHPKSWNTYDSLAEAYAKKGDKKGKTETPPVAAPQGASAYQPPKYQTSGAQGCMGTEDEQ
jgi:predicted Zn-dependent protease